MTEALTSPLNLWDKFSELDLNEINLPLWTKLREELPKLELDTS